MAKLYAHHFDCRTKKYFIIEMDNLEETKKRYTRALSAAVDDSWGSPWTMLYKAQLGKALYYEHRYTMYSINECMREFKELVVEALTQKVIAKAAEHEKALALLQAAQV